MNKLLPCPFCGEEAERNDELSKGIEGVVTCTDCGACAFAGEWNTRAYPRLKEAVKEIERKVDKAMHELSGHFQEGYEEAMCEAKDILYKHIPEANIDMSEEVEDG